MLERASDLFKQFQERVRITMQVVADLAESVGVPPVVTSLLQRGDDSAGWTPPEYAPPPSPPSPETIAPEVEAEPTPPVETKAEPKVEVKAEPEPEPEPEPEAKTEASAKEAAPATTSPETKSTSTPKKAPPRRKKTTSRRGTASRSRTSKKRSLEGNKAKSAHVRALQVDDAINGSTYLARIIWSLGVANLEGIGPLRPADIARMVMSRSPVSLEPPNIARYIRRNNPSSIVIAQKEGSSSFYKLNAAGKKLFEANFVDA